MCLTLEEPDSSFYLQPGKEEEEEEWRKQEENGTQKRKQPKLGRKEMPRNLQPNYKWSPSKRKCVWPCEPICWAAAVKRKINSKELQKGS